VELGREETGSMSRRDVVGMARDLEQIVL